jgi:hypothetical protein
MGSEPLIQLNLEINPKQNFYQIYLYIFLHHAPFHGMILKQGLGHSRSINICDNGLCFKIGILLESPLTHSFGPCTLPSEKNWGLGFDDFCIGVVFCCSC